MMKYDKWQQEILDAEGDILANTGRQVGKTTVFSHKIAKYMLEHPKHQVIVVSLTEDQAQLIIVMVLDYLERNHKKLIKKGKNKPTKSRIWLTNNAHVISRPVGNTGDAVRGFTGNVLYIDEASGMPELMWKAAMPTLMTTAGQIWMSSTPRGKFVGSGTKKNFFFKCWENLEERWQVFNITSKQVIKERTITDDWTTEKRDKALVFLDNQQSLLTEMEFQQEYEGMFLDDMRQWFDDDLIQSCMTNSRPNHIKKGDYYLGVDIARMGEDESTFEIINMQGDHLSHIENQITTKTKLTDTTHHIEALHLLYDFSKVFIDDEGIGVGVLDMLLEKDNDCRSVTIGINNSKQIIDKDGRGKKLQKTLLYSNLKRLMETGKISLLDEPNVFQSLKSVQYAYSNDSLGTRHLKIFGNYTHIAEGLVRAAWCVKYKDLNPTIYTIKI